jgi:hypothetical protein
MRDILIGMLRETISPEGKHLVIVLDGLDEADKLLSHFLLGYLMVCLSLLPHEQRKGEARVPA